MRVQQYEEIPHLPAESVGDVLEQWAEGTKKIPGKQTLIDETIIISPYEDIKFRLVEDSFVDIHIDISTDEEVEIGLISKKEYEQAIQDDSGKEYGIIETLSGNQKHNLSILLSSKDFIIDFKNLGKNKSKIEIVMDVTPISKLVSEYERSKLKPVTGSKGIPMNEITIFLLIYNVIVGLGLLVYSGLEFYFVATIYTFLNVFLNPITVINEVGSTRLDGPFPYTPTYIGIVLASAIPIIGIVAVLLYVYYRSKVNRYLEPY